MPLLDVYMLFFVLFAFASAVEGNSLGRTLLLSLLMPLIPTLGFAVYNMTWGSA